MIATLSQVCSDETNCYNQPPMRKRKNSNQDILKKKKKSRSIGLGVIESLLTTHTVKGDLKNQ